MQTAQPLSALQLVECPRDAMQGMANFVPTSLKVQYIQQLLAVGFHTLDCGSFVSAKAVPQMADTGQVLDELDLSETKTELLTIVANDRGAIQALEFPQIRYLGYPFSISETFQRRNTNATIAESMPMVERMLDLCAGANKELVVYLSMGFGNPYGEDWSVDLLLDYAGQMVGKGASIISLSDTVGTAEPADIRLAFSHLTAAYPTTTFGAHFHATPMNWQGKIEAAYGAGCRRFDGAMGGYGGCPFAKDELTGNVDMLLMIPYLRGLHPNLEINLTALNEAMALIPGVFGG
jgi:hydroxymethylglutaryl-CoA lyase